MSWQLDDALKLVRSLQPETRKYGYHLCLAGGVLNKGQSDKDLDLLFAPLDNGKPSDPSALMCYLEVLWGSSWDFGTPDETITGIPARNATPFAQPILAEYEHDESNTVYQYKRKFFFDGTERIDVFIMKPAEDAGIERILNAANSLDIETPASQPPTDNGIFRAAVPPAIGSISWVGEDGSFPRADSPSAPSFSTRTFSGAQPARPSPFNWGDVSRAAMEQEQQRIAERTRLRERELEIERERRNRGILSAAERQRIFLDEARLLRTYGVYGVTGPSPMQPPANTAPQVTLTPAGEAQLNPPAQPANWEASPNREHLPSTPPAEEDDYFDPDDFDYDYEDDSE